MIKIFCIALLSLAAAAAAQDGSAILKSPDGQLVITVATLTKDQPAKAGGRLIYSVMFHDKQLIEPSNLRLDLRDQSPLGPAVRMSNVKTSSTDETYNLVAGKTSSVRNHFNAMQIDLEETGDQLRKLTIEARAYDDAIAFRYVVPKQSGLGGFVLSKELTQFRLSKDATTWSLLLPNYRSMYESEFVKLPASAFTNQGGVPSSVLIGCPMLLHVPGVAWAAITEADLRDYAAMYLTNPTGVWTGHAFESRLAPSADNPEICVTGSLPHHSAWRVILVGDEPGRLIESNVITSLNPECAIADTSWIHPGKSAWDWWNGSIGADGKSAFTTDTMKYFVDFAAKSGLEYMLVDAGWSDRQDITKMNGKVDIPALVKYAADKNVRIWVWVYWSSLDRQLEDAMTLYEKWGVAGIKTDFMSNDDQQMMGFYYRVAESAARHHIMVDFHGATTPTGMQRTWPNVLGYEAVLGMEQSKAGTRDNPDHHVTLPFTRMLGGLMDYTPGGFDNVTADEFEPRMQRPMVMGTRCQTLAMYAVYEAPLQMVSDYPGAYENQPAFQFIKDCPSTWDQTHVINGLPGEFITIARRHGEDWFLGSMTNWSPRQMEIPLDFLGDGKYTAQVYSDAPDADKSPKNVSIENKTVTKTDTLRASLAPAGGLAVRFSPAK